MIKLINFVVQTADCVEAFRPLGQAEEEDTIAGQGWPRRPLLVKSVLAVLAGMHVLGDSLVSAIYASTSFDFRLLHENLEFFLTIRAFNFYLHETIYLTVHFL